MGITTKDAAEWLELRGIWRRNPALYAEERFGLMPTLQQRRMFEAITPPGAKVTVRAGHGVGKTGGTSVIIWWFLECFDYPKVPCTAPSSSQLRDVLWAELAKLARKADEQARKRGLPEAFWLSNLFEINQDRIADKGAPKEWYAVARTSRKENPDALQGFHASDVTVAADGKSLVETDEVEQGSILFVVEEAPGVDDKIFEVAEGALSSHGARLLMVGNPTKNTGYFARSHKQDKASYTTLHFRCADSPLVDPQYRARLVKKFGEDSNVVRVRADGEFPKQDDDVLISVDLAEAPLTRPKEVLEPGVHRRRLGVDVARFGDDRTVFTFRHGPNVSFAKVEAKQDTMATANQAAALAKKLKAQDICVDVIGIGAGVVDRLREMKRNGDLDCEIIEVNVAESAPERRRGDDEDMQGRRLRDHLWIKTRQWLIEAEPNFDGMDPEIAADLAGELSTPKYRVTGNAIEVESKVEMKKRGIRSTDLADSLALTLIDAPLTEFAILKAGDWQIWEHDEIPKLDDVVLSLHLALGENQSEPTTACTAWGRYYDDQNRPVVMLLRCWKGDDFSLDDIGERLTKDAKRFKADRILLRGKEQDPAILRELRRRTKISVQPVDSKTTYQRGGDDLIAKAQTVAPLLEEGAVWMPKRGWALDVADACAEFPHVPYQMAVPTTVITALDYYRTRLLAPRKDEKDPWASRRIGKQPRKRETY